MNIDSVLPATTTKSKASFSLVDKFRTQDENGGDKTAFGSVMIWKLVRLQFVSKVPRHDSFQVRSSEPQRDVRLFSR